MGESGLHRLTENAVATAPDERRRHARISATAAIDVESIEAKVEARLRDLSLSGARFVTASAVAQPHEMILLSVPFRQRQLSIIADVVRVRGASPAVETAVQFAVFEHPEHRAELGKLITLLMSANSGAQRMHPRVAHRVQLRYGSHGEMRASLGDISRGGLSMLVSKRMTIGDKAHIVLPDATGAQSLELRATVANQSLVWGTKKPTYRVGLCFESMDSKQRFILDALLRQFTSLAASDRSDSY